VSGVAFFTILPFHKIAVEEKKNNSKLNYVSLDKHVYSFDDCLKNGFCSKNIKDKGMN
jgi:hypothetical protein